MNSSPLDLSASPQVQMYNGEIATFGAPKVFCGGGGLLRVRRGMAAEEGADEHGKTEYKVHYEVGLALWL